MGISWFEYIAPFIAGILISLLYHAGLWWTVRVLARSRWPVVLSVGSFYMRMAVTVAVFYFIMQNDWRRLVFCLLGFMSVKFIITRIIKPQRSEG